MIEKDETWTPLIVKFWTFSHTKNPKVWLLQNLGYLHQGCLFFKPPQYISPADPNTLPHSQPVFLALKGQKPLKKVNIMHI